ncbi:glycosyltransferase family 39 protein [Rhodospirillaceae bacterium SYSU D60014]|uniref:glycosyltransferase family 39 protein n=1 Tax=Virgifigura deserti TaxID=2268457 RepID=UPI000E66C844
MTVYREKANRPIDRSYLPVSAGSIAVALLLVVALLVHLIGLVDRSIWGDEAITLLELSGHADPALPATPVPLSDLKRQMTESTSPGALVEALWSTDVHPPLYYLAADLWRDMLGPGIARLRLFSLLAVGIAAAIFYATLRQAAVPLPGFAALIFFLSEFTLFCSANARSYGVALLLVVLTLHLALRSVDCQARCRGTAALLGLCVGAAFLTHYFTLFITGAVLIWHGAATWRRDPGQAVAPIAAALLVGAAALPILADQLGARPEQFLGFSGLLAEGWMAVKSNLKALTRKPAELPIARVALVIIAVPLAAGLLATFRRNGTDRFTHISTVAVLAVVANSLGILGLFYASDKTLIHGAALRYFGFALPFLVIFLAFGIHALAKGSERRAAIIALLVLALQLAGWSNDFRHQARWREIAQMIRDSPTQKALVVLIGAGRGAFGSTIYEFPGEASVVTPPVTGLSPALIANIARYNEIWLIAAPTSRRAIKDAALRIEEHPALAYMGTTPSGKTLDAVEVHHWRRVPW